MRNPGGPAAAGAPNSLHASRSGSFPGITVLALCFAVGIGLGWFQATPVIWPWLALACAGLTTSVWLRRLPRWRMVIIGLSAVALGASLLLVRQHLVARNDLAAQLGDEPVLMRVRGVALEAPILRSRAAGSMAMFDYRPPATYFPMRVVALQSRDGTDSPTRGELLVRVDDTVAPFQAGDEIEATGFAHRFGPPRNPGEFDYERFAASLGQAGVLNVESRELLRVDPVPRGTVMRRLLDWRDQLRRRAGAWLLADLPRTDRTERDAVLAALLLGHRDHLLAEIDDSFRRVGLAHLLAISGLHLGVFVGFVLLFVRWGGHTRRWHGLLVIAVVLFYLLLIDVRMPVLRAGVMTIAAAAGLIAGRRWRIQGLIALSAIALLAWRPDQLFTAGFQLSFGVVLGLVQFVPGVHRRWFGPPSQHAGSTTGFLAHWLKGMLVVAVVAWAIASPITMYHFGMISPLAAPLSVAALPIVAVLLAVGYTKMLLAVLLPSAALLLGASLSFGADVLLSLVRTIDALPGSVVHVPQPPAIWSAAALGWVCAWAGGLAVRRRRIWLISGVVLTVWLFWPLLPFRIQPQLRIDMLAVGDGSCFVLRSGGDTVVYDAGSSTNLNVGRQSLIPAMRALGIRSIDAIIISHPNLDHYSAVLELVEEFGVGRVYVTPHFIAAAEVDPYAPVTYLLEELTQRNVSVLQVSAGDSLDIGSCRSRWLHPRGEDSYRRPNNSSMVLEITAGERVVLMTGDIQERAINELRARHPSLRADILQLPHHGSYNDEAAAFVSQISPAVVLQSTALAMRRGAAWEGRLGDATLLNTAVDGACEVSIERSGAISVGRFAEERR